MTTQHARATQFAQLHIPGDPLILFNIWDGGSAHAVATSGAKAIATGSWSIAAAQGYTDGETMPFEAVITNLKQIIAQVDLPVTLDMEGGYGQSPVQLQVTVSQVLAAGAIGINFEDQIVGGEGLYTVEAQAARISAIRQTADELGIPLFINARTDIFLKNQTHTDAHLEEALLRATAYAAAGASGFFAPGLRNAHQIKTLCDHAPLPVNIMFLPDTLTPKQLADLGVARISYGPHPYRQMIAALKAAAQYAFAL